MTLWEGELNGIVTSVDPRRVTFVKDNTILQKMAGYEELNFMNINIIIECRLIGLST